ncbi:MAG: cupin domain-containing protein [Anaerovoracaceae bacterium]
MLKTKYEIGNWNEMKYQPGREGVKRAMLGIDMDNMLVMVNVLQPGHEIAPEHSHPDEQMSILLSGELDFYTDGEAHRMTAGSWIAIGSGVGHRTQVVGNEPCMIMDIFAPTRPKFTTSYKEFLAEEK